MGRDEEEHLKTSAMDGGRGIEITQRQRDTQLSESARVTRGRGCDARFFCSESDRDARPSFPS